MKKIYVILLVFGCVSCYDKNRNLNKIDNDLKKIEDALKTLKLKNQKNIEKLAELERKKT